MSKFECDAGSGVESVKRVVCAVTSGKVTVEKQAGKSSEGEDQERLE